MSHVFNRLSFKAVLVLKDHDWSGVAVHRRSCSKAKTKTKPSSLLTHQLSIIMPVCDLLGDVSDDAQDEGLARRRMQTAKAREAAVKARAKKQVSKMEAVVTEHKHDSRQELLQKHWFTEKSYHSSYNSDRQKEKNERGRAVYSLMKALVKTIQTLFASQAPEHVINCVIADDTSTRMKPKNGRSQIFTICDTVQSLHVRFETGEEPCSSPWWTTMHVPTPTMVLQASKATDIHSGITSFLVSTGQGVGCMMERFGLTQGSIDKMFAAKVRTEVFVGDALHANDAAWAVEQQILQQHYKRNPREEGGSLLLAIRIRCVIYQLNLVRKPVVLSAHGFWTCLVRLANLFQQHSFRKSFAASMLAVLKAGGNAFHRSLTKGILSSIIGVEYRHTQTCDMCGRECDIKEGVHLFAPRVTSTEYSRRNFSQDQVVR